MMKKIVSFMLVMMLTVSMAFPAVNLVFASNDGNGISSDQIAGNGGEVGRVLDTGKSIEETKEPVSVEEVAALFAALPEAETVSNMTSEELNSVSTALAEAIETYNSLSVEDIEIFESEYAQLYQAVMVDLVQAVMEATNSESSLLSLRPMPETRNVELTLRGYTKEQLQKFPVDEILNHLSQSDGTPIIPEEGYTSAWFYFQYDQSEDYHTLNNSETIDLWDYRRGTSQYSSISYTMYLVLSNGKQLDAVNSHRYIIKVQLYSNTDIDIITYHSLKRVDGKALDAYSVPVENDVFEALGMQGLAFEYYASNHVEGTSYLLSIPDTENRIGELLQSGVQVDVYPMDNFLRYRDNHEKLSGAITEQVFGNGFQDTYSKEVTTDNYQNAPNLWCMVLSDKETQEVLGYFGILVNVKPYKEQMWGNMWVYQNKTMTSVSEDRISSQSDIILFNFDPSLKENKVKVYRSYSSGSAYFYNEYFDETEDTSKQYPNDSFYFSINAYDSIKKVYLGYYSSEQEAIDAAAEDVTQTLLPSSSEENMPYGYHITPVLEEEQEDDGELEEPLYFTVILKDGTSFAFTVEVYTPILRLPDEGDTPSSAKGPDPYFNILDAYDKNGRYLDTYVADEAGNIPLDTYYRLDESYDVGGYQLLLINKEMNEEELKSIIPTFGVPSGVQVNSGGEVHSGENNLQNVIWSESIDDTVAYQVHVPGKEVKNYQVTFATKKQDATLFVAGPDERFVNLTSQNQFVHDILVANIGSADLTGITVELIDPVHVKLDPYWTLGGEGNDKLPAFTTTSPVYKDESGKSSYSNYATLSNIAKIRLLPDGSGEVSGTLRIKAGNGQTREIKLTGIAANPSIVSADLAPAVKYVPYSYMVVTDNMYVWNRSSFHITKGKLPAGMQLYEATGEIYGVPQETGEFTFTVRADFSNSQFESSSATFTLVVNDNTNTNVYDQTSEGYDIETYLGVEQGNGTRDFLLSNYRQDQLYVSVGEYDEFMDLWLNGERLISGEDYTSESGSTRITIKSQTFANKANKNGYNTLAAEFRVDGDRQNELKTTAQNFRLGSISGGSGSHGGGSSGGTSNGTIINTTPSTSGGNSGETTGGTEESTPEESTENVTGQTPSGDTTGGNTQETPEGTTGGSSSTPATSAAPKGITLRFQVLDAQGVPLSNVPVELHSTPRTSTTDENGWVTFYNVEYGPHTFIVKSISGAQEKELVFQLQAGDLSIDGNSFAAVDGSTITIRTQLTESGVSVVNVIAPQTNSLVNPSVWAMVFVSSGTLALSAALLRRKKNPSQQSAEVNTFH